VWYLTKAKKSLPPYEWWRCLLYGKPLNYVLVNDYGVWAWSEVVNDWRPVDVRNLELLFYFESLSELEALVLMGLHDGNANRKMNEKYLEP
jgi:hypothetical protein